MSTTASVGHVRMVVLSIVTNTAYMSENSSIPGEEIYLSPLLLTDMCIGNFDVRKY